MVGYKIVSFFVDLFGYSYIMCKKCDSWVVRVGRCTKKINNYAHGAVWFIIFPYLEHIIWQLVVVKH